MTGENQFRSRVLTAISVFADAERRAIAVVLALALLGLGAKCWHEWSMRGGEVTEPLNYSATDVPVTE